ncbi:MAG TPA: hypothetical protein VLV86_02425 [Vicinamibacterales bacterium]|nr:hypothetical protein [Vicinamibacterales bacterium]
MEMTELRTTNLPFTAGQLMWQCDRFGPLDGSELEHLLGSWEWPEMVTTTDGRVFYRWQVDWDGNDDLLGVHYRTLDVDGISFRVLND